MTMNMDYSSLKDCIIVENPDDNLAILLNPYVVAKEVSPLFVIHVFVRVDSNRYLVAGIPRSLEILKVLTQCYDVTVVKDDKEVAHNCTVMDYISKGVK